ncbi:hypothetical protein F5Y15DRAFT_402163 [Xylariaceae sp. FL0016]|nr:hypothetical protein F5Y15DRAFT_402163 [Xylariaceae sp. FL0016]
MTAKTLTMVQGTGGLFEALLDRESPNGIPNLAQYYPYQIRRQFPAKLFERNSSSLEVKCNADIEYAFDEEKFKARSSASLKAGRLRKEVPVGWPSQLKGPLVWTGSDFSEESGFVYVLSDEDKLEIAAALHHFKSLGLEGPAIDSSSFPLPRLERTLRRIRTDIYSGRGFATLRGLDVDAFDPADLVTVYLGLTSYIAKVRGKQNHDGVMMINVISTSEQFKLENAQVNMPFHTDLVCDTLSMLTLSCGEKGGGGIIASAWTIYNELASTRPDLIHVLSKPDWPFDTFGRDPPFYKRALMYFEDGKLITNFSRRCLVGQSSMGSRTPGIPGLSEAQAEALDALHFIGRRHELKQTMMKGDIRFLNNMGLVHCRDTYTDSDASHRHLLRLWLHSKSHCWKLPLALDLAWKRVFEDDERPEHWHLVKTDRTGKRIAQPIWEQVGNPLLSLGGSSSGGGPKPAPPKPQPPPATACD